MSATLIAPPAPSLHGVPASSTPPAPSLPYYLSMSTLRRFTLAEYHRMIETGVLVSGDPYELLEGWIVRKMSHGNPHDDAVSALTVLLVPMLPTGWVPRPQCAVTLSDDSEPEPDFTLARGKLGTYRGHHPGPSEIGLVVEVSDSSLKVDRIDKGRIYARDRLTIYWVVNVPDQQIEVYSQPGGPADAPAYQQRQDYLAGSSVPVVLDGQTVGSVAVSDILG